MVGQVIVAAIFIGDDDAVAGIALGLGGALLTGVGLWKRPEARVGKVLLVAGSLFALIWFWTVVVPLLALIVLFGLAVTEVRARRLAS